MPDFLIHKDVPDELLPKVREIAGALNCNTISFTFHKDTADVWIDGIPVSLSEEYIRDHSAEECTHYLRVQTQSVLKKYKVEVEV